MKQLIYAGVQHQAHRAASIIDQAAEALVYLAEKGWVHCDIKPDNFLISPQGEVKLIDFALAVRPKTGLARMLSLKAKPQGTMSYMSPEQILGKPLDLKADVYSLGCTVYELVSGKKPFTGMTTNELLQKHVAGQIPALEAANRNVTAEFSALIKRTLAKKPEERPSMADFRREAQSLAVFKVRPKPPGETPPPGEAQPPARLEQDELAAAASPPEPEAQTEEQPTPQEAGETGFDLDEMFAMAESLRRSESPPAAAQDDEDSGFDLTETAPARKKPDDSLEFDM
jgi:serine/threonine protein kinase